MPRAQRTVDESIPRTAPAVAGPRGHLAAPAVVDSLEPRLLMTRVIGTVYNDLNGNGTQDKREPGLSGWVVFRDDNGNGAPDGIEPRTTSDATGKYDFAWLYSW